MSRFSGKFDLYDYISHLSGYRDESGNIIDYNSSTGPFYADEYEDFLAFKKLTGGVIHQHKKVRVTEWNKEEVRKHCSNFHYVEHIKRIKDRRCKDSYREETYYTYIYYNEEYTLEELNKKGVYVTIDIPFDTLLDLIPYYPYIVAFAGGGSVYISDRPYPYEKMEESLKSGGMLFDFWQHYAKELQEHYRDVVLKYYNPIGYEQIDEVSFDENRRAVLHPIDTRFPVKWAFHDYNLCKEHFDEPIVIDADKGIIEMHEYDYNRVEFCGTLKRHLVKYVRQGGK